MVRFCAISKYLKLMYPTVRYRPRCGSTRFPELRNRTVRFAAVLRYITRCGAVRFLLSGFGTVWGETGGKPCFSIRRMILTYKTAVSQGSLVFFIFSHVLIEKIHFSCKIKYFAETHLCKLCVILRSRVLRVVCSH